MARDSFRTYRENSSAQARSAPSARSAASNVRSAGAAGATPTSGRSPSAGASRASNARAGNADASRPNNARSGANASRASGAVDAGRPSIRSTPSDRERAIETGREEARIRNTPARDAQRDVNRDRIPQVYQYAAGLATTPFSLMRRFADDMDRLLQDFGFNQNALASPLATSRDLWRQAADIRATWSPQIETFRRGDQLVVRADLPGLRRDDVKVEIDNGVLAISGERTAEHEEDRDNYFRSERSYGRFFRAIPLPDGVEPDGCHATFRDGVLEVTLPVARDEAAGRREIPIS